MLFDRDLASARSSHWRHSLSWPYGHQRYHLPYPSLFVSTRRHPEHMRPFGTCILWLDRLCILSDHIRNVDLTIRWPARSYFYGHHPGLYLAVRRWKLRQRSHRYLSACLHFLPMDQICQERLSHVGCLDCPFLRVHGLCMGRICLHHQSAATARIRPDMHGVLQSAALRQLQYMVCIGDLGQYADPFRRLLAGQKQRTHVCSG